MKQSNLVLATLLDSAAKDAKAIEQLSFTNNFDLDAAYDIQKQSIERRLRRNENLTGYKLGFTSKAKMRQMGLNDVIWGRLTDSMIIRNDGTLNMGRFIHPRVEPEIAFRVSKQIDKVLTPQNVISYIDAVAPAIEIIDSRYEHFKFSLEDVIADNCSSSGYVIGDWFDANTEVNHLAISLLINNITVQEGKSDAILGNPVDSVIEMSKMATKYGIIINEGQIILAGAATPAEYVKHGDEVQAVFENLGVVKLNVE